jgi:hypothetical protein
VIYMLIPEICSEHASLLYVLESAVAHIPFIPTVTERRSSLVTIVITRFMMNTRLIYYLPMNTIDEFLVSRFIDIKRV